MINDQSNTTFVSLSIPDTPQSGQTQNEKLEFMSTNYDLSYDQTLPSNSQPANIGTFEGNLTLFLCLI